MPLIRRGPAKKLTRPAIRPTAPRKLPVRAPILCSRVALCCAMNRAMRPTDLQVIGTELAVKWDDGTESFILLEKLRRHCPCAGCKGEMDIMGNVYKSPDK